MSPARPEAEASLAFALLAEARALTDQRLVELAGRLRRAHPGQSGETLAYALGTGGKRVRAALVIAAYRTAGGNLPGIAGIAAAVEIVHTYSLVHDDLPCMDDDDQRRGRPTTHVRFDVSSATRAGFVLVPVAAQELAAAAAELGLPAAALGRMGEVLLEASGIRGMVGGQWLDLQAEGRAVRLEELVDIHRRKTGALIEAACTLGGLAAGAGDGLLAALTAYGSEIGLAFQIADDLLDATGTSEELGKRAGRDASLAKATYVSVLGLTPARREVLRHADLACAALDRAGVASETLDALARYIVKRRS